MRVLIDTDPAMGSLGGDPEDSFAILLALSSPELSVVGITTVAGNVPVDKGYPPLKFKKPFAPPKVDKGKEGK